MYVERICLSSPLRKKGNVLILSACDELKVQFAFLRQGKFISKNTQPRERLNLDFNSLSPNKYMFVEISSQRSD